MHIEVDPAVLRRLAPGFAEVGADVDALGSATLPVVAGASAAVGDGALAGEVGDLVRAAHVSVQGAVLCLTEISRLVEAAARDVAARDAAVARTMQP